MTPFSIVNMYLSPPPVFHHPLSLKSRWYFRPSSLSFTSDNIDSGVGRLMTFKKNEIINELKKLLIKAPILNKCVNYFCPWKYESMFSSLSFDAAEFRHDEVSLVWAKLFVYKQKICTFSSWFLVYINKYEIIWIILKIILSSTAIVATKILSEKQTYRVSISIDNFQYERAKLKWILIVIVK